MKSFFQYPLFIIVLITAPILSKGQHSFRTPQASNDILHQLELAQSKGRVLYLAAHPDDENTQVISHLSRKEHIHTAYLSLTRGGGGQNLIGPEQGELLSVLRTQELLQARKVDGGRQFFTRAKDFGYSKTAKESFNIWGKERVLSDVVRVIRRFKPHVIITRFPQKGYEGAHGHHTASALLAEEAFKKAGDPNAFSDQLKELNTWKPKRLLYNTSTWWDEELPEKVDEEEDLFSVNVGKYDPYTGLSYTEIAAEARSMHKCQGFGVEKKRGREMEYFRLLEDRSDLKGGPSSIMDGISINPKKYEGGQKVAKLLQKARSNFEPSRPEKLVPTLLKAYKALDEVKNEHWREKERVRLRRTILACTGTYVEAITRTPFASPGDSLHAKVEFTHRSSVPIKVDQIQMLSQDTIWGLKPDENDANFFELKAELPEKAKTSTHHWLERSSLKGVYQPPVNNPGMIVQAEPPASVHARLELLIDGNQLWIRVPVEYKERSRVRGGVYEPFRVLPPVTANSSGKAQVFPEALSREVEIEYRGHRDSLEVEAGLQVPQDWSVTPSSKKIRFDQKGESQTVSFQVKAPSETSQGQMVPYAKVAGSRYQKRKNRVEYSHITPQSVIRESGTELVQLGTGLRDGRIGYVMGSGDEIPEALRQMGYEVDLLKASRLNSLDLSQYDLLMTGIRAFNVNEALRFQKDELFQYAENGGHLIIQYNKDEDALVTDRITPYELSPSHNRVTEEKAEAKLLQPDHPVFNKPNNINKSDFKGWVQERGLYFADEWDDRFKPLISWHDEGESPQKGGLLMADHGKGTITYTGIAFFRQLPAGVPGAYRLFDNLVQYGFGSK